MQRQKEEKLSISEIIQLIDSNKIILPEFQRDFKWQIDKTETLFDSIFQNLFIGSLIISKPKFSLACKGIDLRPRGSKKHKPKVREITKNEFEVNEIKCLLDGQQRLTSIYRALKGPDHIFIELENINELNNKDWYDYDKASPKVDPEIYIKRFHSFKDENSLPNTQNFFILIKDLYEFMDQREPVFFEKCCSTSLDLMDIKPDEKKIIEGYASGLRTYFITEIVKQSNLLSVQLLDMNLEKFCLYFERSNSQGLNLSFIDIITAKVYVDYKLQDSITKAKKKYPFFDDKLVEPIVRYLNFIENNEVTRKSILTDLTSNAFVSNWENTIKLIKKVKDWLIDNNLIFKFKDLKYRAMIMPLVSYVQHLPSQTFGQSTPEQIKKIKTWYFSSLIDNRYGGAKHGSTNVVLKEDLKMLKDIALNQPNDPKYWQKINVSFSFNDLKRLDNNKSARFTGIMYLLYSRQKFKNLENNDYVSFSEPVDVHHFFPTNFIKKSFGESSEEYDISDSILNKVHINKIANIKYKDKSPSKYLNELKEKNTNIKDSMKTHLIPCTSELLSGDLDSEFLKFISERYKLFEEHLNILSENLIQFQKD